MLTTGLQHSFKLCPFHIFKDLPPNLFENAVLFQISLNLLILTDRTVRKKKNHSCYKIYDKNPWSWHHYA